MVGEEPLGSVAVAGQAGADEPVDVGAVVGCAVADQQGCGLLVAGPYGATQRGPSGVGVAHVGIGAANKKSGDDLRGGIRGGGVGQAVGGLAGRVAVSRPERAKEERDRLGVVGVGGRAERPRAGHPGAMGEKQFEAARVAPVSGLLDAAAIVGVGARVEQDLDDVGVVDLHRALQRRAVAVAERSVVGVRAGARVEQQSDDFGQPGRSTPIDLVPRRVAGVEQGRPAPLVVDGQRRLGWRRDWLRTESASPTTAAASRLRPAIPGSACSSAAASASRPSMEAATSWWA